MVSAASRTCFSTPLISRSTAEAMVSPGCEDCACETLVATVLLVLCPIAVTAKMTTA